MTNNALSKWFTESETDRIILDEGSEDEAWVDIKAHLSIADQDTLSQLLFDIKVETGNPENLSRAERRRRARAGGAMDAKFKPSTVALLSIAIVDWGFISSNGEKLPINIETIGRLHPEWANKIEEEIDARNPLPEQRNQQDIETNSRVDLGSLLVKQSDT